MGTYAQAGQSGRTSEEPLHQAQEKQLTYPEFLLACLREEVRNRKDLYRRQACP